MLLLGHFLLTILLAFIIPVILIVLLRWFGWLLGFITTGLAYYLTYWVSLVHDDDPLLVLYYYFVPAVVFVLSWPVAAFLIPDKQDHHDEMPADEDDDREGERSL